ncbi:MAG: sn-glycerol-3-phosphate ABC transporter ATP-binding protein UgpC [Rhodobacterales bacterium]|nr:sn-glycerol-3-phosphate ABC transporter ATP-binding protein UgpC [Rhodobacterales bacterium]|tara:strand:- start:140 stop:1192 length:1053 start_codon:yes stop_codon:yes gene_type:complete
MMGSIKLQAVEKWFDDLQVIKGIDLEIVDGEFIILVGPSGCGKSTLLRMIGGLEDTSRGSIILDDADVTEQPPSKRGLSMVFQSYALYPHMTVRENMGFSLKVAGTQKEEIDHKVSEAAQILKLEDLLDRRPKDLSGGQRQRVAIGRSIVRAPTAFLFDEPLSNLDASLRVEMRLELARLHQTLKTTMVYVTHDQVEAMTLADRIVVLESGQVAQIGTPKQLYEQPANLFVAQFVGSPKMNIFKNSAVESIVKNKEFVKLLNKNREAATIGVRPEHLVLKRGHKYGFFGRVSVVEYLGADCFVFIDCGDLGTLNVRVEGSEQYAIDEEVSVNPLLEHLHFFDHQGNRLVA